MVLSTLVNLFNLYQSDILTRQTPLHGHGKNTTFQLKYSCNLRNLPWYFLNKWQYNSFLRNQPHGAKSILWTTLAQPFTRAQLEFLPVYHPNASEQKDPKLFASNVRELMAKSLEIPTSSMTFEEVKSRYAKLYKNKRLIKLKDKEE